MQTSYFTGKGILLANLEHMTKYGTSLIIYLSLKEYNFIIFEINWLC